MVFSELRTRFEVGIGSCELWKVWFSKKTQTIRKVEYKHTKVHPVYKHKPSPSHHTVSLDSISPMTSLCFPHQTIMTTMTKPSRSDYLKSLPAIRERCGAVFELLQADKLTFWSLNHSQLPAIVDFCSYLIMVCLHIRLYTHIQDKK